MTDLNTKHILQNFHLLLNKSNTGLTDY